MKQWKLSRMNIPEAPWFIVEANDEKRAWLDCMHHLLSRIPYAEVPHQDMQLPERVFHTEYERHPLPVELYVPQIY